MTNRTRYNASNSVANQIKMSDPDYQPSTGASGEKVNVLAARPRPQFVASQPDLIDAMHAQDAQVVAETLANRNGGRVRDHNPGTRSSGGGR